LKSSGAIRQKFKQARFRAQKMLLHTNLDPRPENCTWNEPFMHPMADGTAVRICTHSEQDKDRLCDVAWGGCDKAKNCSLFESAYDKDTLKEEFKELLVTATLGQIAKEHPDLAALLWVLDEEAPGRAETANEWEEEMDTDPQREMSEEIESPTPEPPVSLSENQTNWVVGTGEDLSNLSVGRPTPQPLAVVPAPETFWQKLWGLFK